MNKESNRIEYKSILDNEKDKLEREVVAFLNYDSLKEIPSPRNGQTFELLEVYYRERGKKLNSETFKKTLDLVTKKGEENYVSYLLADENGVSIKVAKYAGVTKVDLIENDEYTIYIKYCLKELGVQYLDEHSNLTKYIDGEYITKRGYWDKVTLSTLWEEDLPNEHKEEIIN